MRCCTNQLRTIFMEKIGMNVLKSPIRMNIIQHFHDIVRAACDIILVSCGFHTNILKIWCNVTIPSQCHARLVWVPYDIVWCHYNLHPIIGPYLLNTRKLNKNAWKSCEITYCQSQCSLITQTSHDVMWASCDDAIYLYDVTWTFAWNFSCLITGGS